MLGLPEASWINHQLLIVLLNISKHEQDRLLNHDIEPQAMFGHQQPVDVVLPEILPEMPGLVTGDAGDHEFFDTEHAFKLNTFRYFWYIYIYTCSRM